MKINKKNKSELEENGFTIIDNYLSNDEIIDLKNRIDQVQKKQIDEFGLNNLKLIGEENLVRCPFLYDNFFLNFIINEKGINIIRELLGNYAILSLQNSIVIPPHMKHHQSFYHRDIIYQDFTSSKHLGINFYYCLDDYSDKNGGTCFIPRSHKMENFPEKYIEITPEVKAGSIIIFDSMIYHKAGENKSDNYRYGLNQMYTLPFIKQQFDFSQIIDSGLLGEEIKENSDTLKILGYRSREFNGVVQYREEKLKRIKNE